MSTDGPPRTPGRSLLPAGLVLRDYRPADLDQVGELLTARGEAHDAVDHRLVVTDPDLGPQACAVVVDGDRVVATATLLDETVQVAGVDLPAGQVELVAVAPAHEHRGLARALMGWAHERSTARGQVLQVMIGIPYFYRLFGYAYAIDIPPARELVAAPVSSSGGIRTRHAGATVHNPPLGNLGQGNPGQGNLGQGEVGGRGRLRVAADADLPALVGLQAVAQRDADVVVPHPAARWRALLAHSSSRTVVLERAGGPVASARVRDDGDEVLVAEATAVDAEAADALLAALDDGRRLRVVDRVSSVTGAAWSHRLAPADDAAEQYYVRIADPAAVLDALRPVLTARAGQADGPRVDLLISTFGAHYRLPWRDDGFGPVDVGGPMQSPGEQGGFGVAPDRLAALLLGPGFAALRRVAPDVYGPPERGAALFPPMTADLLSYYLPW